MRYYIYSEWLGLRFCLGVTVLVSSLFSLGCLKAPGRAKAEKPKSQAFMPPASPEMLAADAAQSMSQLGARVIHNEDGTVRSVVFTDLPVSDAALTTLKDLPDLEVLSLSGTRVTNTGMTHLTGLERLTYLFMNNTQVTDEGLMALADSVGLRYISLDNTSVTSKAVEEFRKLSPGTVVQHSPRRVTLEQLSSPEFEPFRTNSDGEFELNRIAGDNQGGLNAADRFGDGPGNRNEQSNSVPPASAVRLRYRAGDPKSSAAGSR